MSERIIGIIALIAGALILASKMFPSLTAGKFKLEKKSALHLIWESLQTVAKDRIILLWLLSISLLHSLLTYINNFRLFKQFNFTSFLSLFSAQPSVFDPRNWNIPYFAVTSSILNSLIKLVASSHYKTQLVFVVFTIGLILLSLILGAIETSLVGLMLKSRVLQEKKSGKEIFQHLDKVVFSIMALSLAVNLIRFVTVRLHLFEVPPFYYLATTTLENLPIFILHIIKYFFFSIIYFFLVSVPILFLCFDVKLKYFPFVLKKFIDQKKVILFRLYLYFLLIYTLIPICTIFISDILNFFLPVMLILVVHYFLAYLSLTVMYAAFIKVADSFVVKKKEK